MFRILIVYISLSLIVSLRSNSVQSDRNSYSITSIESLRKNSQPDASIIYYTSDRGQEGAWKYDPMDKSSPDNTGTVLVSQNGHRFKRIFNNENVEPEWFGVKGDGITNETANLQKAVNAALGKTLVFKSSSSYRFVY